MLYTNISNDIIIIEKFDFGKQDTIRKGISRGAPSSEELWVRKEIVQNNGLCINSRYAHNVVVL